MGSAWQGSVWKHKPASINQAPGSHQPSGPTTVQTDYQRSFTSLAQPPAPLPHLLMTNKAWQAAAEMSWPTQPRTHHYQKPRKHQTIWPCLPRGSWSKVQEKSNQRKSPWKREVSIGACDWANWNQHPWLDTQARAFGSTSHANISHHSTLPCRQWGQPAEEWHGSHACHDFKKERNHRGATVTSPLLCAPTSALLRKDIIYIYGSEGALGLQPGSRLDWV